MNIFRLLSLLIAITFAQIASAQTATLLADHVDINADTTITATGNVEVMYGDARLRASELEFNSKKNLLIITGPITLIDGSGTVIVADQAELEPDLQNGIIRSARMVLQEQLQLASNEIHRVDGRYTQLNKTVASSCRVCAANPVPLWHIRAERVIHDQQERQIYFYNAQFRVGNVPILYLPRLRMPDPTQTRARGFLLPKVTNSSRLGIGLKVPYFIPIGDHKDITFTPYYSEKTRTLEARYRQAFRNGNLTLNGAVTRDELLPDELRWYAFLNGNYNLPRDFTLRYDIETTSDPAYLLEYGYSGKDRLDSAISIERIQNGEFISTNFVGFTTLRGTELNFDDPLPNFQGELDYRKRFYPASIGGQGLWNIGIQGHNRASTLDVFGRDVLRFGTSAEWSGQKIFANGMVGRLGGRISADAYRIEHDSTVAQNFTRIIPAAEAELRWPLVRTTRNGASEVLEPVIHFGYADLFGNNPPDEDSSLVDLDEGNLFSLSRFPGEDRYELGARTTAGLQWTRHDPNGWSANATLARVFRPEDLGQFTIASGLDGTQSDWLVAGGLDLGRSFEIDSRALLNDDLSVTKAEARMKLRAGKLDMASNFAWVIEDAEESRPDKTRQMTLSAGYALNRHWSTDIDWRYDFEAERATSAAVGLKYRNECIVFDVSLSRRFTSSTSVTPTTDIGLSIGLAGFGTDGRPYARTCSGL